MASDKEFEIEARWFEQILDDGARDAVPEAGGHICQGCGEVGLFADRAGEIAGSSEQGDFLGFGPGHGECRKAPNPAITASRPWRHCEVCRRRVKLDEATRVEEFWLCEPCAGYIAVSDPEPEYVLGDLAFRRWAGRIRFEPRREAIYAEVSLFDSRIGEPGPPLQRLPHGLEVCSACGTVRGVTFRAAADGRVFPAESVCLCQGLRCRRCEERRIRRPISDYFDPRARHWWHVPYFAANGGLCRWCRNNGRLGHAS